MKSQISYEKNHVAHVGFLDHGRSPAIGPAGAGQGGLCPASRSGKATSGRGLGLVQLFPRPWISATRNACILDRDGFPQANHKGQTGGAIPACHGQRCQAQPASTTMLHPTRAVTPCLPGCGNRAGGALVPATQLPDPLWIVPLPPALVPSGPTPGAPVACWAWARYRPKKPPFPSVADHPLTIPHIILPGSQPLALSVFCTEEQIRAPAIRETQEWKPGVKRMAAPEATSVGPASREPGTGRDTTRRVAQALGAVPMGDAHRCRVHRAPIQAAAPPSRLSDRNPDRRHYGQR